MIQGTQWPSFIIQSIILGANLYFLIEGESGSNIWIFLSLACVLSVFSLQTTNTGFLYLYPFTTFKWNKKNKTGNKDDDVIEIPIPSVGLDTWILRLFIMASALFLFLGILKDYNIYWNKAWLIFVGVLFLFAIPLVLNTGVSDYIRARAVEKAEKKLPKYIAKINEQDTPDLPSKN